MPFQTKRYLVTLHRTFRSAVTGMWRRQYAKVIIQAVDFTHAAHAAIERASKLYPGGDWCYAGCEQIDNKYDLGAKNGIKLVGGDQGAAVSV